MAIIDSLLKLVELRGASALVVRSGLVPQLEKSGSFVDLSMPPMERDMVDGILEEVLDDGERAALHGGQIVRKRFEASDGSRFGLSVEPRSSGSFLTFRLGAAPASSTASTPTAARTPVDGPSVTTSAGSPMRAVSSAESAGAPLSPSGSGPASHAPSMTAEPSEMPRAVTEALLLSSQRGASDVFLSEGEPPLARIGTALKRIELPPFDRATLDALCRASFDASHHASLATAGSADFALAIESGGVAHRYRGNAFHQERGLAFAFRPIRASAPSLEELLLPSDFRELVRFRSGLVLFVGTAGSGKSTTLASLVDDLNRTEGKHIVTIEDPIELIHTPLRALIHQREIGRHVQSFDVGLRAALREAPDVILVGEMRDRETIAAAITAAETGHLVLSTLHSGSAAMAIDRMIDIFPQHQQTQVRYQLADCLRAVVTQILIGSTRPNQRVVAFEKLVVTPAVANKIRDSRGHQLQTELQRGGAEGMVTLERSLASLVQRSLTTKEQARAVARDTHFFDQLVGR